MTQNSSWQDVLEPLLDKLCTDGLNDSERALLNRILREGREQRAYYRQFLRLHAAIQWNVRQSCGDADALHDAIAIWQSSAAEKPATSAPMLGAFGHSLASVSRNTIQYFSEGWPLAYLLGSLIFCGILTAFSLMHVSDSAKTSPDAIAQNAQKAGDSTESSLSNDPAMPTSRSKKSVVVGRITGEADCAWKVVGRGQWAVDGRASGERKLPVREISEPRDKQGANAPRAPSLVCLGDRLAITSGLLEITYNTGAKVVLQGPCTYTAESISGGFLAVGQLTAELEKGKQHADSVPQSASPSFFIRTPTALVTDLGTEFGVNVQPDKTTTIHVIRGVVEATRDAKFGGVPIHERLTAGQAIYIASLNDLPQRIASSDSPTPSVQQKRSGGRSVRMVFASDVRDGLREGHEARQSRFVPTPVGLVATAYHHVLNKDGMVLAENDRTLAFRVATDGIFGRGVGGERPRNCFDTKPVDNEQGAVGSAKPQTAQNQKALAASHQPLGTNFVGLRYDHLIRFDRIKVFMGRQEKDGGGWAEPPRVFILKNLVDTDRTSPENDPINWREVHTRPFFGVFSAEVGVSPGMVLEIPLTGFPEKDCIGYGWAVGGVKGNGSAGYISVTELRAYTTFDGEEKTKHTTKTTK